MSHKNLKLQIDLTPGFLEQPKTIDGGSKYRSQIVVIRLDITMLRQSIMTRCKRMHNPCIVALFLQVSVNYFVIVSCHFHAGDDVFESMTFRGLDNHLGHQAKTTALMFDRGWFDKNSSIEVTHHPL
jgi:hypothetical protein